MNQICSKSWLEDHFTGFFVETPTDAFSDRVTFQTDSSLIFFSLHWLHVILVGILNPHGTYGSAITLEIIYRFIDTSGNVGLMKTAINTPRRSSSSLLGFEQIAWWNILTKRWWGKKFLPFYFTHGTAKNAKNCIPKCVIPHTRNHSIQFFYRKLNFETGCAPIDKTFVHFCR